MSRRKYPFYAGALKVESGICEACGNGAAWAVTIQVSWFRGDDDMFLLCEPDRRMAMDKQWKDFYTKIKTQRRLKREAGLTKAQP